jgi:hypothetical protein
MISTCDDDDDDDEIQNKGQGTWVCSREVVGLCLLVCLLAHLSNSNSASLNVNFVVVFFVVVVVFSFLTLVRT